MKPVSASTRSTASRDRTCERASDIGGGAPVGLTAARSKWFMGSIGHEGLNNLLAAYPDKSARAVCTFGYVPGPGHEPRLFQGVTQVGGGGGRARPLRLPCAVPS